jgi:hypothetical protein
MRETKFKTVRGQAGGLATLKSKGIFYFSTIGKKGYAKMIENRITKILKEKESKSSNATKKY